MIDLQYQATWQSGNGGWRVERRSRVSLVVCASALFTLSACGAGCNRSPSFVPSSASSRQALEAVLGAWVNGQALGPVQTVSPPIQVVDSAWQKGQRLDSFEIIGEEKGKDGLPYFTVRLHKSRPQGEETVRYVVTGRSPMWVFREDDYKSTQSWEGYK
jgi:hypothetical protein